MQEFYSLCRGKITILLLMGLVFCSCKRADYFSEDMPVRKKVSLPSPDSAQNTSGSSDGSGLTGCSGLISSGVCYQIHTVGLCSRSVLGSVRYKNFIYPVDTAACGQPGYTLESSSHFKSIKTGGVLWNVWTRDLADGAISIYLPEGEEPTAGGHAWKLLGPGFRILKSIEDVDPQRIVPIYKCAYECDKAKEDCAGSVPWLSLKSDCESLGKHQESVGWVIRP